jgi:hypothetical protein
MGFHGPLQGLAVALPEGTENDMTQLGNCERVFSHPNVGFGEENTYCDR